MVNLTYFERLTEAVTLLVRHPEYPNKGGVLHQCRREITELIRAGRLSVPQAEMLFTILDSADPGTGESLGPPSPCGGACPSRSR